MRTLADLKSNSLVDALAERKAGPNTNLKTG